MSAHRLTSRKTFLSENAYRSHVQSRKHRDRELAYAKNPSQHAAGGEADHVDGDVDMVESAASSDHGRSIPQQISPPSVQDSDDESSDSATDDEDEDEGDIEANLAASRRRRHLPSDCLFCTHRSTTIEACLQHMSTLHSFFIPDQDYLSDMSGLLAYLGEKIVVGNICLYCPGGSREFGSVEAVRRHMIDKSHCKMAFETDDDRIEVSDFYTYEGESGAGDEWEDVDDGGDDDGEFAVTHSSVSSVSTNIQILDSRNYTY
jgi:pre-60S factor REI1